MFKEARIKELLTGQKQFGKITVISRQVDERGGECPKVLSEKEFYNPTGMEDITVNIIYEEWQKEL